MDIENVTTSIAAVAEQYPDFIVVRLSVLCNQVFSRRQFIHKQILGMMGYEVINYSYLEYSTEDRQPVSNLFGE